MFYIELLGFTQDQVLGVESAICDLFEHKPYRNEYVVVCVDSIARDHQNRDQPFLRLFAAQNDYLEDIISELRTLKFHIVVMLLYIFIPK